MDLAEAIQTLTAHGAFGRGIPLIPGTNIALLTKPSKMPGYSWSLPAGNARNGSPLGTCPGAVFGEGSICGSCYANPNSLKAHHKTGVLMRRGGSYGYKSVREAQAARHEWLFRCLTHKDGQAEWVTVMTAAITWATRTGAGAARGQSRRIAAFRFHDAGDVLNPAYGRMIEAVCAALPDVRFWLPTRSYRLPRILPVLQDINALPNVAVRPSALFFHEDPPRIAGLSAGTGAAGEGFTCPSSRQGGRCDACRMCWSKDPRHAVVYKVH
jgi:hypothetical protein